MLEKFADGNSAAAFTPNRKVPFLLIMQCSCEGPGSALLVSFIFLQMGMRQGTGLGVQAQATCVFEMVLLTVPFLLHLPSSSFPLALFSLSLCSLSFFLSSSPHLPLWTKISGKRLILPFTGAKSSGYSFFSLAVLNVNGPQHRKCGVVGAKVRGLLIGGIGSGSLLLLPSPVERIFCPWSLYFLLIQGVWP